MPDSVDLNFSVSFMCTATPQCLNLISPPQADLVKSTHRPLYGLETNVNYEVRVRCKMLGSKEFGEFSDSVFIYFPSRGKHSLLCLEGSWKKMLQVAFPLLRLQLDIFAI